MEHLNEAEMVAHMDAVSMNPSCDPDNGPREAAAWESQKRFNRAMAREVFRRAGEPNRIDPEGLGLELMEQISADPNWVEPE